MLSSVSQEPIIRSEELPYQTYVTGAFTDRFILHTFQVACEQALLFEQVKRVSRERASERRSRQGPLARAFSGGSLRLPKQESLLAGYILGHFFPRKWNLRRVYERIRYQRQNYNLLGPQVLLTGLTDFKNILISRQYRSKNKLVRANAVTRIHGRKRTRTASAVRKEQGAQTPVAVAWYNLSRAGW